jgi:hypothetical protein
VEYCSILFAWIVIPQENPSMLENEHLEEDTLSEQRNRDSVGKLKNSYIGLLFIVVGAFFLIKEFLPWNLAGYTWPFILITVGILLLVTRSKDPPRQ